MSNHTGSYLLNEVLKLMDARGLFAEQGTQVRAAIAREIVELATARYDCNADEILDGLGTRFGLCYNCLRPAEETIDGLCAECHRACFM